MKMKKTRQDATTALTIAVERGYPALIQTRHHLRAWTPLHLAARGLNARIVASLPDDSADVMVRGWHEDTAGLRSILFARR
jgi:hypothetical protein